MGDPNNNTQIKQLSAEVSEILEVLRTHKAIISQFSLFRAKMNGEDNDIISLIKEDILHEVHKQHGNRISSLEKAFDRLSDYQNDSNHQSMKHLDSLSCKVQANHRKLEETCFDMSDSFKVLSSELNTKARTEELQQIKSQLDTFSTRDSLEELKEQCTTFASENALNGLKQRINKIQGEVAALPTHGDLAAQVLAFDNELNRNISLCAKTETVQELSGQVEELGCRIECVRHKLGNDTKTLRNSIAKTQKTLDKEP